MTAALAVMPALTAGSECSGLHGALRDATRESHERLRRHTGFAAVKEDSIGRAAYQALLARLYGFHLPFEKTAAIEADRSNWPHADLLVLGSAANAIAEFPVCGFLPRLMTQEQRLGARYVIEGSTLGGLTLCKGLDRLLNRENIGGRQFFHGRGRGTAQAWSGLLARLTEADHGNAECAEILGAAVQIFSVFEAWLTSWRDRPHD